MLQVGVSKVDITAYEPHLGMMGWGVLGNVVKDVATPLHARAFAMRDLEQDTALCMVVCELAFISSAMREGVCERLRGEHPQLGLDLHNVMLMATHTHSGPGGLTHYPFYNITIPGFSPKVWRAVVDGIVSAIVNAFEAAVPATMRYAQEQFSVDSDVAFNRSIPSYNRNRDVTPVALDEPKRPLDKTLRLLRFDAKDGTPLGSINWFAVHCTSVHSDNTALHFDNKGYAAQFLEEAVGDGFVGAFAQGASGDVTPNFRRHDGRPWVRGASSDDDESARVNGRLQFETALRAFEAAGETAPLVQTLQHVHQYVDFSRIEVEPRFVGGQRGRRTAPAEIGMSMFFGTEEGPGLPRPLLFLQDLAARLRPSWRKLLGRGKAEHYRLRDETHAEKISWLQTGERRFFGMRRFSRLPLPWKAHPALRLVRELDRHAVDDDPKPWTPNILPMQLFRLGDVAIAAVPAEFTTVAGIRLRDVVAQRLHEVGVEHAVLAGYANAYAGYVTTPEEYALQDYEGGSTHFGKWTHPAYLTEFAKLCRRLTHPHEAPPAEDVHPPAFTADELAARQFPVG
jgi:neutral ceramidase